MNTAESQYPGGRPRQETCSRCGARFNPADPAAARAHAHHNDPLRIRYQPQQPASGPSFVSVLPPQCSN